MALDDFNIPFPCNNFLINNAGIFLLQQGTDTNDGRIVQYTHQMKLVKSLLTSDEANTKIVISNSHLFTNINDSTFAFAHPLYPELWVFKNNQLNNFELDFNSKFVDISELEKMESLDRLHYINDFEGFYNITNGVKLNDNELLYSIRYKKKNGFIKINLKNNEIIFLENIKNNLMKVPSSIIFAGNNLNQAWYLMNEEDIDKFYNLNKAKIPDHDKITLSGDGESKVLSELQYK